MHHLLGGPWATLSRIIRIRSYRAGAMDKRFSRFFSLSLFCLLTIRRLTGKSVEKAHEDFWQKSWKSQAPLARTTKINLQSIPMHRLLRAPETTPSWILRTRSGGGGRGV